MQADNLAPGLRPAHGTYVVITGTRPLTFARKYLSGSNPSSVSEKAMSPLSEDGGVMPLLMRSGRVRGSIGTSDPDLALPATDG